MTEISGEFVVHARFEASAETDTDDVAERLAQALRETGAAAVSVVVAAVRPEVSSVETGLATHTQELLKGLAASRVPHSLGNLIEQGFRDARAILAMGYKKIAQVPEVGPSALKAIRENLAVKCPEIQWLEVPTATQVAAFCPGLNYVPIQVLIPTGQLNISEMLVRNKSLPPFTVADVLSRSPELDKILGASAPRIWARAEAFAEEFMAAKLAMGKRL